MNLIIFTIIIIINYSSVILLSPGIYKNRHWMYCTGCDDLRIKRIVFFFFCNKSIMRCGALKKNFFFSKNVPNNIRTEKCVF